MYLKDELSGFIPTPQATDIIKSVTLGSSILRMSKVEPMTSDKKKFNVMTDGVGAYWVGEGERIQTSKATWIHPVITAKKLAVIIPVTREKLNDSTINVFAELKESIAEAFYTAIDSACLFGTNSPFTTNIMKSIADHNMIVTDNKNIDIAVSDALAMVEENGHEPSGFIGRVGVKNLLRKLRDNNGAPAYVNGTNGGSELYGRPVEFVRNGAWDNERADVITGEWKYSIVGIREGISYEILREATLQGTPEQLARVNTEIQEMSKRIPVQATELANLAATAGQLGVDADHVAKFTEITAAMGVATNLAGEEGAATLAQFINVSGDSLDNVDRVGSAIVALGNNTATTEADIAHMALRMGKFGNTVHMTSDEVLGYSAALASSGIEAQLGGSAMGRTWLDIQSAVSGNTETLQKYAKYAGTTAEEFKKQWSTDPSGVFNGLIKGLSTTEDLTSAMMDLGIENIQDQQAVMALANNYGLLEKCMNLSSSAYKENTALSKEANTAYATTANQIQLAKNAVNGAARSWGNVLLPEVAKGAGAIGNLADKIANADEGTKKAVISGAKAVVITGAAVKGTTSLIKGIGGTVEGIASIKKGIDKVKTVAGAGGVFSTIAKGASAAGSAILPVGAAIVGVTAAVGAGKLIYDSYYKSTYKFADGLKEQGEAAKKAYNEWRELNNLQWEYNDLSGKMERGELNGEDLEHAKQRIEEIKKILSEKFKIDLDSGDIDDAIEKAKTLSEIDVLNSKRSLRNELDDKKGAYDEAVENLPKLTAQLKEAKAAQEKYNNTKLEIAQARDAFESGTMGEAEYLEKVKTSMKEALGNGKEYSEWLKTMKGADTDVWGQAAINSLNGKINGLDIEGLTKKISDYQTAIDNYKDAARSFADMNLSQMEDAFKVGGDITPYMQEIGNLVKGGLVDATEYASKIALMKEGFTSLGEAAKASKLDTVSKQITDISRQWGVLPKNKSIKIDVQGNTSVIDDVSGKIEQIETKDNVKISVDAEGNIEVLDEAGNKMGELKDMGAASLQVNAEGDIDVLDEAGNKIAEIDGKTGKVTITAEDNTSEGVTSAQNNINSVQGKQPQITAKDNTGAGVSAAKNAVNSVKDRTVTITVNTVLGTRANTFSGLPSKKAKGTQNFGGGLAMVNDQTGISDPRELIIDRGRAFIPQGRNVILPLSRGAKVYTAAQTKRIMANMGIPQYAEGKDNSDAFKTAKDDWTHYTRTHAVSVTEEMRKWVALSKEFTSTQKDVEDIQEGIWAATRKVRDEQNELSEEYLATRAIFNDWDEYSDSMAAGFRRVSDREKQYVKDSVITEKEANTYLKRLGKDMFDDRVENSKAWLERQVKYNNMSVESYIESVEKMKAAAYEAYGAGMITSPQLNVSLQEYDDMIADKTKEANAEKYEMKMKNAEEWITNNETFGWQNGDSLVKARERVLANIQESFEKGEIDWDTYIFDYNAAKRNLYNAQSDAYDEMLEAQRAYIDEVDDGYNKLIDKKEEAFDMRVLTRNISEASEKAKIYAGAVTQRGKDVYKETTENLEDLLHQKTVKELQAKQTEVVEKMRADLDTAEKYKKQVLNSLSDAQIDITGIARSTQGNTANMQGLFSVRQQGLRHGLRARGCLNLTICQAHTMHV